MLRSPHAAWLSWLSSSAIFQLGHFRRVCAVAVWDHHARFLSNANTAVKFVKLVKLVRFLSWCCDWERVKELDDAISSH